jgi:tetratricopeptide (TPR) repeat protein
MLETLKEYAAEQLETSGERRELVQRHGHWFLELAEEAQPHLRSSASSHWQQRLGLEMSNFRAAMDRALEDETRDPVLAIRLATALHFFWYRRGLMTEARERLERALDADPAPSELRTRALMAAASLARYQNQPKVAEPMVQEALDISTELGDQSGIANALRELGALAERDKDYDGARGYFEKAIALYRNLEEPERLAWTYNNLGIVAQLTGSLEEAAGHYEASLGVGREIDDPMTIATAYINLGEIAQLRGQLEGAKNYFRDSLGVWQSIGHRLPMAHCLEVLASIDLEQGRPGEAAELLGAADAVREEIGVPVEPFNRERYDRDLDGARSALGEGLFEEAWQRGRALTIDEAVAAARVDLEGG